jgi:hypothetical protein
VKVARTLKSSRQLPVQLEKAEAEDRVTLKSLRAAAQALGCELVYALVPKAAHSRIWSKSGRALRPRGTSWASNTRWRLRIKPWAGSMKLWKRKPSGCSESAGSGDSLPRRRGQHASVCR